MNNKPNRVGNPENIIRQILKHLGLWLPRNHDPPEQKTIPAGTQISNMIEMVFGTPLQAIREEVTPQMPYEEDYSQITPLWERWV